MVLPRRSATAAGPALVMTSSGYADVSELERYQLISNIGKGSFGVISKVKRLEDGKEFALKQLDYSKMTDKDRKQIVAEVAILESLRHRNIVQLVQKIKDPKNERIYIVMEYCTSGDLGSLIRKAQRTQTPIHEDKIWNVFLQITLALHHCHWPTDRPSSGRMSMPGASNESQRCQVLHRDLKPENVFLSGEFVKLGDFGLSKDMGNSSFTSTYVGTPLYMPPEILAENRYDTKSDIWSLGCLVFEMCALSSPFSAAQTQAELITMVKSGKLPQLPNHISPALKNAIRAMLNLNPTKRPSTKDLLEMDEMQLHRKLFTVQNQASLLLTKRDEIKQLEEQIAARIAAVEDREKALLQREKELRAREEAIAAKDEENRETQRRLNTAAEQLRGQWDRLREEKERDKDDAPLRASYMADEEALNRSSSNPTRPHLGERNTIPIVPASRSIRYPNASDQTPSKIPLGTGLVPPLPVDRLPSAAQATPLRRAATKSLGNISSAYRADATPARQTVPDSDRKRSSLGSPSELQYNYCEDVSMVSVAPTLYNSPAPFVPRPRKSSLAPNEVVGARAQGISVSTSDSTEAGNENASPQVPPTMTMIPKPTFVYKEASTPAKWALEDPDLPSPFLRRAPSAPAPLAMPERQVLSSINVQSAAGSSATSTAGKIGRPPIPRSRSGGLHQHVLRANAHARTSGEGGRARAVAPIGGSNKA